MSCGDDLIRILICGGGNGAHVYAGIAASKPNVEARVLTLYSDEAERWTKAMDQGEFVVNIDSGGKHSGELRAKPTIVSKDPAKVTPGCHIIIIVVPAFAHEQYFKAVKPYVEPGTIIVGLPGQAGFEFACRGLLEEKAKICTIINFESLPWACRTEKFGVAAEVLGTKQSLVGAMNVGNPAPARDPKAMLQHTLGEHPVLNIHGHLLGMTFMGVNGYIHPSILYGRWYSWDGNPVKEKPLFYHGMDEFTADTLSAVSDEIMTVSKAITKKYSWADFTNVCHVYDWYKQCYSDEIIDDSCLLTAIRTNKAYIGLTHPCIEKDDGTFMPNFNYRYITEDIPFGLAVLRGVAEIVGIPTPHMDKIMLWTQKLSGKEYLVGGKIQGKDVKETRCPQKYNLTNLEDILGF